MLDLFALAQHDTNNAVLPIATLSTAEHAQDSFPQSSTAIVYAGGDNFPEPPTKPK